VLNPQPPPKRKDEVREKEEGVALGSVWVTDLHQREGLTLGREFGEVLPNGTTVVSRRRTRKATETGKEWVNGPGDQPTYADSEFTSVFGVDGHRYLSGVGGKRRLLSRTYSCLSLCKSLRERGVLVSAEGYKSEKELMLLEKTIVHKGETSAPRRGRSVSSNQQRSSKRGGAVAWVHHIKQKGEEGLPSQYSRRSVPQKKTTSGGGRVGNIDGKMRP